MTSPTPQGYTAGKSSEISGAVKTIVGRVNKKWTKNRTLSNMNGVLPGGNVTAGGVSPYRNSNVTAATFALEEQAYLVQLMLQMEHNTGVVELCQNILGEFQRTARTYNSQMINLQNARTAISNADIEGVRMVQERLLVVLTKQRMLDVEIKFLENKINLFQRRNRAFDEFNERLTTLYSSRWPKSSLKKSQDKYERNIDELYNQLHTADTTLERYQLLHALLTQGDKALGAAANYAKVFQEENNSPDLDSDLRNKSNLDNKQMIAMRMCLIHADVVMKQAKLVLPSLFKDYLNVEIFQDGWLSSIFRSDRIEASKPDTARHLKTFDAHRKDIKPIIEQSEKLLQTQSKLTSALRTKYHDAILEKENAQRQLLYDLVFPSGIASNLEELAGASGGTKDGGFGGGGSRNGSKKDLLYYQMDSLDAKLDKILFEADVRTRKSKKQRADEAAAEEDMVSTTSRVMNAKLQDYGSAHRSSEDEADPSTKRVKAISYSKYDLLLPPLANSVPTSIRSAPTSRNPSPLSSLNGSRAASPAYTVASAAPSDESAPPAPSVAISTTPATPILSNQSGLRLAPNRHTKSYSTTAVMSAAQRDGGGGGSSSCNNPSAVPVPHRPAQRPASLFDDDDEEDSDGIVRNIDGVESRLLKSEKKSGRIGLPSSSSPAASVVSFPSSQGHSRSQSASPAQPSEGSRSKSNLGVPDSNIAGTNNRMSRSPSPMRLPPSSSLSAPRIPSPEKMSGPIGLPSSPSPRASVVSFPSSLGHSRSQSPPPAQPSKGSRSKSNLGVPDSNNAGTINWTSRSPSPMRLPPPPPPSLSAPRIPSPLPAPPAYEPQAPRLSMKSVRALPTPSPIRVDEQVFREPRRGQAESSSPSQSSSQSSPPPLPPKQGQLQSLESTIDLLSLPSSPKVMPVVLGLRVKSREDPSHTSLPSSFSSSPSIYSHSMDPGRGEVDDDDDDDGDELIHQAEDDEVYDYDSEDMELEAEGAKDVLAEAKAEEETVEAEPAEGRSLRSVQSFAAPPPPLSKLPQSPMKPTSTDRTSSNRGPFVPQIDSSSSSFSPSRNTLSPLGSRMQSAAIVSAPNLTTTTAMPTTTATTTTTPKPTSTAPNTVPHGILKHTSSQSTISTASHSSAPETTRAPGTRTQSSFEEWGTVKVATAASTNTKAKLKSMFHRLRGDSYSGSAGAGSDSEAARDHGSKPSPFGSSGSSRSTSSRSGSGGGASMDAAIAAGFISPPLAVHGQGQQQGQGQASSSRQQLQLQRSRSPRFVDDVEIIPRPEIDSYPYSSDEEEYGAAQQQPPSPSEKRSILRGGDPILEEDEDEEDEEQERREMGASQSRVLDQEHHSGDYYVDSPEDHYQSSSQTLIGTERYREQDIGKNSYARSENNSMSTSSNSSLYSHASPTMRQRETENNAYDLEREYNVLRDSITKHKSFYDGMILKPAGTPSAATVRTPQRQATTGPSSISTPTTTSTSGPSRYPPQLQPKAPVPPPRSTRRVA